MNVFELYGSLGLKTEEFSQGLSSAITDITKFGGIVANVIDVVKKVDNVITTISNTTVSATGDLLTGAFNIAKAFDDNVMGAVDRAEGVVVNAFSQMASAGYDFFRSAVDEGMSFDAALGQVSATLLQTREGFDGNIVSVDGFTGSLRDLAKELGATTKFTATQAGEALNYMALAGYDAQTSAEMLPKVLDLAAAGAMDLGTASDMVTDAQTALGLSIDDTSVLIDQMAKTASSSNTSVSQLGDAILTIGATGRMVKGGFTELNTALGILADNGIKASEGGNELRRILVRLTAPGQDAAATMESLGFSAYDAQGNIKSLPDMFADLNQALSGYTPKRRNAAISDIFGQYALAGANALLKTSSERWEELTEKIVDSEGAAKAMAEIQLETLPGQVTLLTSAFSGLKTEIFEKVAPTMRDFIETLTTGLGMAAEDVRNGDWGLAFRDIGNTAATLIKQGAMEISDSSSTITEFIDGIVLVADKIGTALFESGSEVLPRLSGHLLYFSELLIQKFADFLSNQENVDTITDTIGVLIDQISTFLDNNSDDLYTIFSTLFDLGIQFIDDLFVLKRETVYELIYRKATELLDGLPEKIVAYLNDNKTEETANNILSWVGTILTKLIDGAEVVVPKAVDFLLGVAGKAIEGVANYLSDEENVEKIRTSLTLIIRNLDTFLHKHSQDFYTIVETIYDLAVEFLPQVFKLKRETTAAVIATLIKKIFISSWFEEDIKDSASTGIGTPIGEGLAEGVSESPVAAKNLFRKAILAILGAFTDGFEIHSPSELFKREVGAYIGEGIVSGISDKIEKSKQEIDNIIDKIKKPFTDIVDKAKTWGSDLIDNFISGISSMKDKLGEKANEIARTISEFLHFSLPEKGPLSESDEWMPDFMSNLAQGIEQNRGLVQDAIKDVAGDMQIDNSIVAPRKSPESSRATSGNSYVFEFRIGNINGTTARDAENFAENVSQLLRAQVFREQAAYI